ncbi:hypothetical protein [uncultured Chryseobacterium sp.]|uniref:hypothetical protein n=1 Tax=uncultured Chryseobacterium sp. TaxID=259322 RepID=UPI0026133657|nr:hypothetical protein [uncultured Chryseobacterium sp.]
MAQEKFYFNKFSKFKEFPEEEILHLIDIYNSNMTFAEIKVKYPGIETNSFFYDLPFLLSDEPCIYCKSLIYSKSKRVSKQSFHALKYCINCHHDYISTCGCENCENALKQQKLQEEAELEMLWKHHVSTKFRSKIQFQRVYFHDLLKLKILFDNFYDEKTELLIFPESFQHKWKNPSRETPLELKSYLKDLAELRIIAPSKIEAKNLKYVRANPDHFLKSKPLGFHWKLNVEKENCGFSFLEFKEIFENHDVSEDDRILIWNAVYQNEVSEYLHYYSKKFLGFSIDESISHHVSELLKEDYSLSKAFYLLYSTLRQTSKYQNSFNQNTTATANYLKSYIEKLAEKFRNQQYLKGFDRPLQMPYSAFNDYALRNILKLKENHFYLKPNNIYWQLQSEFINN